MKVLITCPPMLKQIDSFYKLFEDLNIKITTPEVSQTLSVEELLHLVPKHDGWIIGDDPANAHVLKAGKSGKLKAAVKWGIGMDNVDIEACKKLNIPVINTPGMFGAEVADLAMCYILGLARDAFFIDREIRKGNWPKPSGISLGGKIIGIVGLGDIGLNIAKRAAAHDMKIIGWDPFNKSVPKNIQNNVYFPDGVELCDFIVFSCPLTNQTMHIFNNEVLSKVKKGVRIINVSRGPLIDEKVLFKGLSLGIIESVALDVFEKEPLLKDSMFLKFPSCILGSHNASNTKEAVDRASKEAINLLSKMLK